MYGPVNLIESRLQVLTMERDRVDRKLRGNTGIEVKDLQQRDITNIARHAKRRTELDYRIDELGWCIKTLKGGR